MADARTIPPLASIQLFSLVLFIMFWACPAFLTMPNEPGFCNNQPADVLLGYALDTAWECRLTTPYNRVPNMEVFKYVIGQVNHDMDILPNVSVGYVIMDTCNGHMGPVNAIVHFLPDDASSNPRNVPRDCTSGTPMFPVIAVIGPLTSQDTFKVAPVMSAAHIPIVSTLATSDELGDPDRFEYSVRMSLPDRYQTKAILEFIEQFEWSYFGLIYSEGSYGENGAKHIEKSAPEFNLCVAFSEIVYMDARDSDIEKIIDKMVSNEHLRVVVLFLVPYHADQLYMHLAEDLYGRFIWVGSDAVGYGEYGFPAHGAFIIHFAGGGSAELDEYISTLTPSNTSNHLMYDLWETQYNCLWNCSSSNCTSCDEYASIPWQHDSPDPHVYVLHDATYTLLRALHNLFTSRCPGILGNISLLESCFSRSEYLDFIHNVSFDGLHGPVEFDQTGTALGGSYAFKQYSAFSPGQAGLDIADWDMYSGINVKHSLVNWTMFQVLETRNNIPISLCSLPCPPRHFYIQKQQVCCWDCFACRDNEIITDNMTSCVGCPENQWPDEATAMICEPIPPVYVSSDNIGIALTAINGSLLCISLIVVILLVKHRSVKLIRASSREMMGLILSGVIMAFITVFLILLKPTDGTCLGVQLGFHLSVSVIYAPLFLKTNRIYRIFAAGRAGTMAKMVSTRTQLIGSLLEIAFQVVLLMVSISISNVKASVRMPIWTERYSELYCNIPVSGFSIPLSYNLVLLLACAIFGYKTRKFPENFNESWYIFVCVSTTVFLWLVFLPTYFTAFYATHQAALLATCLIINACICEFCLFIPKFYAVYFVKESDMKFVSMNTSSVAATE